MFNIITWISIIVISICFILSLVAAYLPVRQSDALDEQDYIDIINEKDILISKLENGISALKISNEDFQRLIETLNELEVPVIQLFDDILFVIMVGHYDSRRLERLNELALNWIHITKSKFLILQISGIPIINKYIIDYINLLIKSASMLGAQVIITGMSPEFAIKIVQSDLNINTIKTFSEISMALDYIINNGRISLSQDNNLFNYNKSQEDFSSLTSNKKRLQNNMQSLSTQRLQDKNGYYLPPVSQNGHKD